MATPNDMVGQERAAYDTWGADVQAGYLMYRDERKTVKATTRGHVIKNWRGEKLSDEDRQEYVDRAREGGADVEDGNDDPGFDCR